MCSLLNWVGPGIQKCHTTLTVSTFASLHNNTDFFSKALINGKHFKINQEAWVNSKELHGLRLFSDEHIFWLLKLASSDEKLNKLELGIAVHGMVVAQKVDPDTVHSRLRQGSSNKRPDWRGHFRKSIGMEFLWLPPCNANMQSRCIQPMWRWTGTRKISRRKRCYCRRHSVDRVIWTTVCWCSRIRRSTWRSKKRNTRDQLKR